MTYTADDYRQQLLALQPPGLALPTHIASTWAKLLHGLADELARVRGRIDDMRRELSPLQTDELLTDWERVLGLPDPCAASTEQTAAERLARVAAKVAAVGGQSRLYFIGLAQRLGLTVEIQEPEPFYVGTHGMGDPIGGADDRWMWVVHVAGEPSAALRVLLECSLQALKPAGSTLLFDYGTAPTCVGPFYVNGAWAVDGTATLGAGTCPLPGSNVGPFFVDGSWACDGSVTCGDGWAL